MRKCQLHERAPLPPPHHHHLLWHTVQWALLTSRCLDLISCCGLSYMISFHVVGAPHWINHAVERVTGNERTNEQSSEMTKKKKREKKHREREGGGGRETNTERCYCSLFSARISTVGASFISCMLDGVLVHSVCVFCTLNIRMNQWEVLVLKRKA